MNNFKIANDFNIYVLNDHTQSNVDSEGRVAVTNNATYSNYGIGNTLTMSTTRPDLVVGGKINIMNGSNFNGNTVISNLNNVIQYTMTNNNGISPQPIQETPINFIEQNQYLLCASKNWALLPTNGIAKVEYGGLTLTGTNPELNIFNIDGTNIDNSGLALANLNKIDIVAPIGSTILINVSGNTLGFGSYGMFRNGITATGYDGQYILFNLYEATNISAGTTSVKGSLLAPLATYDSGYTNIEGTIMVKNLYGNIEAHNYPFIGNLPDVCTTTESTTTESTTTESTTTESTTTESTTTESTTTESTTTESTTTESSTSTENPCAFNNSIDNILDSVAKEQNALAQIISSESEKIKIGIIKCTDCKQILCLNNSVENMLVTITNLEIVLQNKIKTTKNICSDC